MEITEKTKTIYNRIQSFINSTTSRLLNNEKSLYYIKKEYWEEATLDTHIKDEIFTYSGKLVELQRKHPILHIITRYHDLKNVLWESTFIEELSPDEKKKYIATENLYLDFKRFEEDNTIYDELIPYFSGIVSSIFLINYISFLKDQIPTEDPSTSTTTPPSTEIETEVEAEETEIRYTFEANFSPIQVEIISKCINEARIFTKEITSETFDSILSCTIVEPLKARNNRLLVYFFYTLDDYSLITRNWQSVIDKNALFLSSGKGNPLKQSDLSTANSEIKITPPIGSEIIDKYIKEVKKH